MKKLLVLALAAALCGCCCVNISHEGGRDLVEITNTGWRLFGLFAIASGDPEYPNQDVSVWFCDSILLDVNMMLLDDTLRKHGYSSFKNISSCKTKESVFFLFNRLCYRTSAELVK